MIPDKTQMRQTVVIENVAPTVDGGRYAVKREVGAVLEVTADIFKEGHDVLRAYLKYRRVRETEWRETPMRFVDNDRWAGAFTLEANDRYLFTIEAFPDPYRSWLADLDKRHAAGQDAASELLEGAALIRDAAGRASGAEAEALRGHAESLGKARAHDPALLALMDAHLDRSAATWYERELPVFADRERARFAAWYELFPRSAPVADGSDRSATFREAEAELRRVAAMGFDVVYLPPIHPIGRTHRKGKNNALTAAPGDPGSPWAIGSEAGGHDAVHPELGTLEDFDRFVQTAGGLGLEVVIDFAIQASPDHPWVREHPEWFFHRPDGTIKYAENPPKKYQDVYPLDFVTADPTPLWEEMRRILRFWIGHGVRGFRVDNPHTKPVRFWEWLIREIQDEHPEVSFLAEAFTRPRMMKALAKAGFTQSYTYFTWRNEKQELIDYLEEISRPPVADSFRGHLWPNTPDILHETLQKGGRPAFKARLVLAATLSSLYGIYSGYELGEHEPFAPGSEEYRNSEKYEIKRRDWNAPGNLVDLVTRINRIRREHPALQLYTNLRFYPADDPAVLFYGKMTPARDDVVLVAVSLDWTGPRSASVQVPLGELGLSPDQPCRLHELLTDTWEEWRGGSGRVMLDPGTPARIFALHR